MRLAGRPAGQPQALARWSPPGLFSQRAEHCILVVLLLPGNGLQAWDPRTASAKGSPTHEPGGERWTIGFFPSISSSEAPW
jgi:hypothetical protein